MVNGVSADGFKPDIIYITSLFTYAWEPVHEVIRFYGHEYKKAKVITGGVYASLCYDHLQESFGKQRRIARRQYHLQNWDIFSRLGRLSDFILPPNPRPFSSPLSGWMAQIACPLEVEEREERLCVPGELHEMTKCAHLLG